MSSWTSGNITPNIAKQTHSEIVLSQKPWVAWMLGMFLCLNGFILFLIILAPNFLGSPSDDEIRKPNPLPLYISSLAMGIGGLALAGLNEARTWTFNRGTRTIRYRRDSLYNRLAQKENIIEYSVQRLESIQVQDFQHQYNYEDPCYSVVLSFQQRDGTTKVVSLTDANFDSVLKSKQDLTEQLANFLNVPCSTQPIVAKQRLD